MKVLQTGNMLDGTHIQIEEWNENYSFMPYGSTLASYPKSKVSHEGVYSPKGNKNYRFEFNFDSEQETKNVFNSLINGEKTLLDYKINLNKKEYADCI